MQLIFRLKVFGILFGGSENWPITHKQWLYYWTNICSLVFIMTRLFATVLTSVLRVLYACVLSCKSVNPVGLGNIYGNHELRDQMDRQTELRIIDNTLWKHFERLE